MLDCILSKKTVTLNPWYFAQGLKVLDLIGLTPIIYNTSNAENIQYYVIYYFVGLLQS